MEADFVLPAKESEEELPVFKAPVALGLCPIFQKTTFYKIPRGVMAAIVQYVLKLRWRAKKLFPDGDWTSAN